MYSYQYRSRHQNSRFLSAFSLFLILTVILGGILFFVQATQPHIVSPLPNTKQTISQQLFSRFQAKKNPEDLKNKLRPLIEASWKNYSIVVKDYTSEFSLTINDSVIFTAASLNKLPIFSTLYYLTQNGEIDLDKTITLQEQDIQDYGTGSIRYDPPGTVYSLKTLARLMMQKSDNTAAYILANHVIGVEKIQALIDKWNLTQTNIVYNKTSNKDMALLFEKIFTGKIANQALTQEMLAFLKDTDFEDRIPALLPEGVTVYHKTGNGEGFIHDLGIVVGPKTTYYIGILTSDIHDEENATKTAALVSKTVYDFMK